jgi:hypothetical protein
MRFNDGRPRNSSVTRPGRRKAGYACLVGMMSSVASGGAGIAAALIVAFALRPRPAARTDASAAAYEAT